MTALSVPTVKTLEVGAVLFQYVVTVCCAAVEFKISVFAALVNLEWYTGQESVALLRLTIIISGATPNPCPTVAFAPVPVYVTILKPCVAPALIVDVIEPAVFVTAGVPLAFQLHPT